MANRNVKKPQPVVTNDVAPEMETQEAQAQAEATLDIEAGKGTKPSLFSVESERVHQKVAQKMEIMGTVRQKLAEAADTYSLSGGHFQEADRLSGDAALSLYNAQVSGLLSKDEVSGVLGDVFGFKLREKDGKPGKTPEGHGEAIRKRVVRAVAAAEYVTAVRRNEDTHGGFFSGLPEGEISAILMSMEAKDISIWSAYDDFGKLKAKERDTVDAAFNPKSIQKIVEKLSEDGAREVLKGSQELIRAYAALIDILAIIGEEDGE